MELPPVLHGFYRSNQIERNTPDHPEMIIPARSFFMDPELRAELDSIRQLLLQNSRDIQRLLEARARGVGGVASNEPYPLHLRLLFSTRDAYLAALVYDVRLPDGSWDVKPERPFSVTVRIRKTQDMVHLVEEEHALTATDVVRVLAEVDPAATRLKGRTVSGLHRHRKDDAGERRNPKKLKMWQQGAMLDVVFPSLERVCTVETDTLKLYALAAEMFPPTDGVMGAAHAHGVGLMLPPGTDTVAQALRALGVEDADAIAFFEAAVELGPDSTSRLATDPRFTDALAAPRTAATNVRVKNALDRARRWVVDTDIVPASTRTAAIASSLPVNLIPEPPAPRSASGAYKMRGGIVASGAYGLHRGALIFVRADGQVTGYVQDYVFRQARQPAPVSSFLTPPGPGRRESARKLRVRNLPVASQLHFAGGHVLQSHRVGRLERRVRMERCRPPSGGGPRKAGAVGLSGPAGSQGALPVRACESGVVFHTALGTRICMQSSFGWLQPSPSSRRASPFSRSLTSRSATPGVSRAAS